MVDNKVLRVWCCTDRDGTRSGPRDGSGWTRSGSGDERWLWKPKLAPAGEAPGNFGENVWNVIGNPCNRQPTGNPQGHTTETTHTTHSGHSGARAQARSDPTNSSDRDSVSVSCSKLPLLAAAAPSKAPVSHPQTNQWHEDETTLQPPSVTCLTSKVECEQNKLTTPQPHLPHPTPIPMTLPRPIPHHIPHNGALQQHQQQQ